MLADRDPPLLALRARRPCSQNEPPPHSLHLERSRPCSQIDAPPHSLHLERIRSCSQIHHHRTPCIESADDVLADFRPTALLAQRAPTAVLADLRPAALLALRAPTTVLADSRPTAVLAPTPLPVRTSAAHLHRDRGFTLCSQCPSWEGLSSRPSWSHPSSSSLSDPPSRRRWRTAGRGCRQIVPFPARSSDFSSSPWSSAGGSTLTAGLWWSSSGSS